MFWEFFNLPHGGQLCLYLSICAWGTKSIKSKLSLIFNSSSYFSRPLTCMVKTSSSCVFCFLLKGILSKLSCRTSNPDDMNGYDLFLMSLGICFPSLVDADVSSAGGGGVWGPDDDDETCGVEGGVVLGVEVRSGCEPCASTWETRQLLLLERFLDSVFSSLVLSLPGHAHTRIFKAFRPKTWLLVVYPKGLSNNAFQLQGTSHKLFEGFHIEANASGHDVHPYVSWCDLGIVLHFPDNTLVVCKWQQLL